MYEDSYYWFLILDTVREGVVFWHKKISKETHPTDWHIDEIYPWFRSYSSYWAGKGLNRLIDTFDKELYWLTSEEKEYLRKEMEKSIEDKRDIIIHFRNTNKLKIKNFSREEVIKKLNGEKFGLEKLAEIDNT